MDDFNGIGKYIADNTDKYFTRTRGIIERGGDKKVIYVYFLRTPSLYAPLYAYKFLQHVKQELNIDFNLHILHKEQDVIPANTPIWFLEGSFQQLCELETLLLQKIGIAFVVAYKAYLMCTMLKQVSFISMGARHYPNPETATLIDYGISVGSKKAASEGALGFIGSSTTSGSTFFNQSEGMGTMPHALIGYAGSTLNAAKLFHQNYPQLPLTVLVDYFGREVDDTLEVCYYFKDLAANGLLGIRLDTHGSRYFQGLDQHKSWDVINRHVGKDTLQDLSSQELEYIVGPGVSAAAIFQLRETLNRTGFPLVKIVVSSGFTLEKCRVMAKLNVPIDTVGTGSLIYNDFHTTFTTADIIAYDDVFSIKKGRESFIKVWQDYKLQQTV